MVLHKRTFPLHPCLPIQLDLLTRSQGAQQKENGLYVRGYDSQMKCCMYCGNLEGQHQFHGEEEYMQHPSTAKLEKRWAENSILIPQRVWLLQKSFAIMKKSHK